MERIDAERKKLRELGLNEQWLESQLREKPSLLGLEFKDAEFLAQQRSTSGGGRLDLLFFDRDNNRRFVVELMLGALDEKHIVRTLEYWDVERRRYPAHDHVAVVVAEDITSRFLNVLSLMSGTIPLIALQLSAIVVQGKLVLHFSKVLDLTELRVDDDAEIGSSGSSREEWVKRCNKSVMDVVDDLVAVAKARVPQLTESYMVHYLGFSRDGMAYNFATFRPTRAFVHLRLWRLQDREALAERLEGAGLDVTLKKSHGVSVRLTPDEFRQHKALIEEAFLEAMAGNGLIAPPEPHP